MSYTEWECPECGEKTSQPDWITLVYCRKFGQHKTGKQRRMRRVDAIERSKT